MEEAAYVPAPGHPEPYRRPRRRRAVLPEGRAQSTAAVRAESSPGFSQCTQHAPHAPKKRHCTRRQGSDRAPTSWSPLAQQNPNNDKLNPRTTVPGSLSCPPLARHYGKLVNFRLVDRGGKRQNWRRRSSGFPPVGGTAKKEEELGSEERRPQPGSPAEGPGLEGALLSRLCPRPPPPQSVPHQDPR